MLRGAEDDAGSDGDEERQAGKPDEPPSRSYVEPQDHMDVQVDTGKCATYENADATDNVETTKEERGAQVNGESTATCQKTSITG